MVVKFRGRLLACAPVVADAGFVADKNVFLHHRKTFTFFMKLPLLLLLKSSSRVHMTARDMCVHSNNDHEKE